MNQEMIEAATDALIASEWANGAVGYLAERLDKSVSYAPTDEERLARAGRAYELRNLIRDYDAEAFHDANPYCDFCSARRPLADMGELHGLNRCNTCEQEGAGEEDE